MIVKFLDTQTGKTAWSNYPFSISWWAEGNGACDCNRALLFDYESTCYDYPLRYQAVDIADHPDKTILQQIEINIELGYEYLEYDKMSILDYINDGF